MKTHMHMQKSACVKILKCSNIYTCYTEIVAREKMEMNGKMIIEMIGYIGSIL